MKKAGVFGLGMAVAIELAGCTSSTTGSVRSEARPQPPQPPCLHRIASVLLGPMEKSRILAGHNVAGLQKLETTPADGVYILAPAVASPAEIMRDDRVIMALGKFIKANRDAVSMKELNPTLADGDLRVTTYQSEPVSDCATLAPPGVG